MEAALTSLGTPGAILLAAGFATYAAVIAGFCYAENRADETFSATTPITAMLTFALGAHAPSHALVIDKGQIVDRDTIAALKENEAVKKRYLAL